MEETQAFEVRADRVQRLLDALSLAAIGDFDAAIDSLRSEPDRFGELEETVRLFVSELGESQRQRSEHVAQLEAQGRDLQERLTTIELQNESIQKLSTPILEVDDDVVVLPLVGAVDEARAETMTRSLLDSFNRSRARFAVVDLTGASVLDSQAADLLRSMVHSARLIGATCVLAGIGPALAITAIRSGIDFGDVLTFRGLKEAVRHCAKVRRATATLDESSLAGPVGKGRDPEERAAGAGGKHGGG